MGRTSDVPGALRGASVFVLSSRGEGFPLAPMEAMATAVPCAAFDCAPGVHEIITDGEDGLLATLGNTGELARRLDTLMSDKALRDRMGEAARVSVQRYTTAEIVTGGRTCSASWNADPGVRLSVGCGCAVVARAGPAHLTDEAFPPPPT